MPLINSDLYVALTQAGTSPEQAAAAAWALACLEQRLQTLEDQALRRPPFAPFPVPGHNTAGLDLGIAFLLGVMGLAVLLLLALLWQLRALVVTWPLPLLLVLGLWGVLLVVCIAGVSYSVWGLCRPSQVPVPSTTASV